MDYVDENRMREIVDDVVNRCTVMITLVVNSDNDDGG